MARITLPGNQVAPRAAGQPHVQRDNATAAAVAQLGGELEHVADEYHQVHLAAERARDASALNSAKDQLIDAYDEHAQGVVDGTVPKDEADKAWTQRAKEIGETALSGITNENQRLVAATDVQALTDRLGNKLRRAVALRDRQDVSASIDTTLEYLQRQYNGDPAKTTAQAMAMVDQMGPFSTFTPQELAHKKQGWKESTQYTAGYEVVNAAKNSPALLDKAEAALKTDQFADMDPQRRAVLENQIDGHRVRLAHEAELRAQRAERQYQHHMTQAKAAFDTAQTLADKGVFSPEYFEAANKATAGTPYNAGLKGLLEQTRDVGALASMPITRQRAELDAINAQIAKNGISPELAKRKQRVEKVVKESEGDYAKDAMRAGNERGVIQLQPLDMSGGLPGLLQQLGTRVQQAEIVRTVTGKHESPLVSEEAATLGRMLSNLAPSERANAVGLLSTALPAGQAQALAKQIDQHDRALALGMALGTGQTSAGLPASRLLFLGQQSLKDQGKGGKEGDKPPEKLMAEAGKELGDMLSGQARQDVIEAAALISLGKTADGQPATMRKSVEIALGGPIIQHAGKSLPAAPGMTTDRFRDALAGPSGKDVAKQLPDGKVYSTAGQAVPFEQFLAELPQASLMAAGTGRYYVRSGAGVAVNAKGEKIVVEVK